MGLDNKYFSYCKEIGIMKENYSQQSALNTIINEIKNTYTADPAFIAKVEALTLNSPEVSVRSCVLYRYDIDVNYVVSGRIKHTRLYDFGSSGVHDSIHITEYKGEGNYTILNDASQIPYSVYNSKNLFTYDEMKNALKGVISKNLPSGWTSYETNDWSISAYIVPVLVIIMKHNNKEYQMYYNLQNGYYHWEWPLDPVITNGASKAHKTAKLLRTLSIIAPVVGLIIGASAGKVAFPVIAIILNAILAKKVCKGYDHYKGLFKKNKNTSVGKCIVTEIVMLVIGVIALFSAL